MASGTIFLPSIEGRYVTDSTRTISQILPALGPELIRHVIEDKFPHHRVRVVYGDHEDIQGLDDLIDPDDCFVGFSCTGLSYRPALPLAQQAHERGLPVLFGGTHARLMAKTIRQQHPEFLVVPGPGEHVVTELLNGTPPEHIQGIVHDDSGEAAICGEPYEVQPFLHETTDYSAFFKAWGDSGVKLYRDDGAEKLVAVRGITGCTKAVTCSFCTVQRAEPFDPEIRGRYLVEERRSIIERFGERVYILDCSDALPEQECLEAIAKHLNGDPSVRVHSGGMVWELVRKERFNAALRAGYNDFLVGLEGFSSQHFPHAMKPAKSIEMMYQLLEQSRDTPARYFVSGIIGWPGESEATLLESYETACRLLEYDSVVTLALNFLMPMPGSALHYEMIEQGIIQADDECPDMQLAFAKHIERNCQVSLARLQEFTRQVSALDSRVIQVWGVERDRQAVPAFEAPHP